MSAIGSDFVNGDEALRISLVYERAGRPLPVFSDDDYIDFAVVEAITLKRALWDQQEHEEKVEESKVDAWKAEWGILQPKQPKYGPSEA